jgi:hypothetical protein
MAIKAFARSLNEKGAEGELIKTFVFSLVTSVVIFGIAWWIKLRFVENFFPKYGYFLLFAVLSYSFLIPAVQHVRAYKQFNCMTGMMIGMTLGMVAGFLGGLYVGATNGMFIGGIFGMALGILVGTWTGGCCGIMGFMEGIMAGFMGGLMGAMTAVMLLNDHLRLAIAVIFVITTVILISLNYLIFRETREHDSHSKTHPLFIVIWTALLTLITLALMIWGPKSGLFI